MIILKCGDRNLAELTSDEFEWENRVDIIKDGIIVGDMTVCPCGYCLGLESIEVYEPYRGKGYGTEAMELLKKICKDMGTEYIHGDSPNIRKPFYIRLGAKYECRYEYDETFMNDRFYIDL